MSAQFGRIQQQFSTADVDVVKGSGVLTLNFVSPKAPAQRIRTTKFDWRGVLVFCPGRKVTKISMATSIVEDTVILDALKPCGNAAEGPARQPQR